MKRDHDSKSLWRFLVKKSFEAKIKSTAVADFSKRQSKLGDTVTIFIVTPSQYVAVYFVNFANFKTVSDNIVISFAIISYLYSLLVYFCSYIQRKNTSKASCFSLRQLNTRIYSYSNQSKSKIYLFLAAYPFSHLLFSAEDT